MYKLFFLYCDFDKFYGIGSLHIQKSGWIFFLIIRSPSKMASLMPTGIFVASVPNSPIDEYYLASWAVLNVDGCLFFSNQSYCHLFWKLGFIINLFFKKLQSRYGYLLIHSNHWRYKCTILDIYIFIVLDTNTGPVVTENFSLRAVLPLYSIHLSESILMHSLYMAFANSNLIISVL